jgi:hypothetical protein
LKLGGNLEFSWYSCNILRYCSNRCIVWFFIPANCPAQANRKFPVQLYVKIQILFEPPFWICKWANHLSFLAMDINQIKQYNRYYKIVFRYYSNVPKHFFFIKNVDVMPWLYTVNCFKYSAEKKMKINYN